MFKKINQWIEKNQFWAESIRTIIFSFIGTLIAIFVIKYIESKSDFNWDKKKARLSSRLDAINSFMNESYEFTSLSVRYAEGSIKGAELRNQYDYFRSTLHILTIHCIALDPSIEHKGKVLSEKMMLLINERDSLLSVPAGKFNSYEKTRREIKNESDSIVFRLNLAIDKD